MLTMVQKNWSWTGRLENSNETPYIVIHHTTGTQMQDT